ncbi:MAG: TetR/AcrR family transcriptional regulator [Pseudomonadota bacterium]
MKYPWDKWDKRGWERADKIGKTAAKLFSRKSYFDTTIDDIAAAGRFSKGSVYYYFKSKSDILFFILYHYMENFLENLEDLDSIDHNEEKLISIISRHIELYAKNTHEGKVLLHDSHCLPKKYYNIIAKKQRTYFKITEGVISSLIGKPVSKGQLTSLTFTIFGMCNWIHSWYDPKGSVTPRGLSEVVSRVFLHGIKAWKD